MTKSNLLKKVIPFVLLIISVPVFSQQNAIKIGLVDLLKINMSYERAINTNRSINVNFAFYRPRSLPGFLVPDEIDDKSLKGRFFAYAFIPEYRFYFSKKDAPRGFYLSTYLKYSNYSVKGSDIISGDLYNVKGSFYSLGLGAQLGAQWIISEAFTIDWYFLGVEFDRDVFAIKYSTDSENPDFETVKNTIEKIYSGIPILGSYLRKLTGISTGSNYIRAKVPLYLPDIRTGLSIGYAF